MSTENMRAAKAYLKEGGFVVTGMERPLDKTNYYPKFFGRPRAGADQLRAHGPCKRIQRLSSSPVCATHRVNMS